MPEETYKKLAFMAVAADTCYKSNHIDSNLFAETIHNIKYSLTTFTYVPDRLNDEIDHFQGMAKKSIPPTKNDCKNVEALVKTFNLDAKQHRDSVLDNQKLQIQSDNATELSNAIRSLRNDKPITCHSLYGVTRCF